MTDKFSAPEPSSAPALPKQIAQDVALILEQYPNIGKKITQLWGSTEMHSYLNSIVFDERGGRHGFPENIVAALFRIVEAHRTTFPESGGKDIWEVILNQVK